MSHIAIEISQRITYCAGRALVASPRIEEYEEYTLSALAHCLSIAT
ncbi:MAG: hypothetical protein PVI07_10910 [Anaerolineae bacterium]